MPVSEMLAPAPLHDDVSLAHTRGQQMADQLNLEGDTRVKYLQEPSSHLPKVEQSQVGYMRECHVHTSVPLADAW